MVRRQVLRMSRLLFLSAVVACCAAAALWLPTVGGAAVPGHGRAWELVTSTDTNGVPLLGARAWSADGDRILIWSRGPLPGASANDLLGHATAVRTPQGWVVTPVANRFTSPASTSSYPLMLAVTSDLSASLWASPLPLLPGAPSDPRSACTAARPTGRSSCSDRRAAAAPLHLHGRHRGPRGMRSSRHRATCCPLTPGASGIGAYELVGSTLRLVGVDAAGAAFPCGAEVGNATSEATRMHAVSARRPPDLLLGIAAPAATRGASTCARTAPTRRSLGLELHAGRTATRRRTSTFAGATPDGAQALLVTSQQLTDDDIDDGARPLPCAGSQTGR